MTNVMKAAKALHALHQVNLLKDPACKDPVVLLIRQATEPQDHRHWHATTHYRSKAAEEFLSGHKFPSQAAYHQFCRSNLRHEHVVPNIVLYRMILIEPDISESYLQDLFIKFGKRATITKEENVKLLQSKMPPEFFIRESELYMNHLARYIVAGLHHSLSPLVGDSWFVVDGNTTVG